MAMTAYAPGARMRAGVAALAALAASLSMPAFAQDRAERCAGLAGTERVACLRTLLAETQAALDRAERDLGVAPAVPAPQATTAPPPAAEGLGAEQVARRAGTPSAASEETQRVAAVIVATQRTQANRLQMRLENGQLWRQLQSDMQVVDLPAEGRIAAEIWPSGFGGYRMRLTEIGRIIRVERLR